MGFFYASKKFNVKKTEKNSIEGLNSTKITIARSDYSISMSVQTMVVSP